MAIGNDVISSIDRKTPELIGGRVPVTSGEVPNIRVNSSVRYTSKVDITRHGTALCEPVSLCGLFIKSDVIKLQRITLTMPTIDMSTLGASFTVLIFMKKPRVKVGRIYSLSYSDSRKLLIPPKNFYMQGSLHKTSMVEILDIPTVVFGSTDIQLYLVVLSNSNWGVLNCGGWSYSVQGIDVGVRLPILTDTVEHPIYVYGDLLRT